VKTVGDAFLVEFASALEAIRCAFDVQQSLHEMLSDRSPERRIQLRIGIHVGDVIHSQNDIYGDAVNVASRIEPLAAAGGICVTEQVYDHVRNKFEFPLYSIGRKELKNVGEPTEVFRVVLPWEQSTATQAPKFPANRIAVLPFASFSPDPNDEYFADGMTEELISTMSKVRGLRVIARTSIMGYKGGQKKVSEVVKELEVGTVLEGSVRKAGDRLRITAQLIDSQTSDHLWAESYDRKLDDVFAVQSDVAKQVADALRVRILAPEMERIEKKPTESTTAYALYLKGRHFWNKRGVENTEKAREYFELAVHEDPNFALGYVGQADCCLILQNWGFDMQANLEKAEKLVARALELDPGLAEAHTTRGLALEIEYNLREAEEEFREAIELKPNYATAHQWYFLLLLGQLRWDEALAQIERALELDPLSPVINYNHGLFYHARRDYGRALELFKRVTALDPGYPPVHYEMTYAYGRMKMLDEMRHEAANVVELLQDSFPLARMFADTTIAVLEDDRQTLRRLLPELETRTQEPGAVASLIAVCYFHLGEKDKGFEWLERAFSKREDLSGIKWDPDFDEIRADSRYLNLLKRLGLE